MTKPTNQTTPTHIEIRRGAHARLAPVTPSARRILAAVRQDYPDIDQELALSMIIEAGG